MIALLLAFACVPVDGAKILARHVASVVSGFAELAPDTDLGYVPLPGVTRVIHAEELQRVALKHGLKVTAPVNGLCFEWPMRPMERAGAANAMQKTLPANSRLEVIELSRAPVPDGVLEFPLEGLRGNLWRGVVRYGEHGRFDVWARVRVTVKQTRVVAVVPLRGGELIGSGQVRVEEFEDTPATGLASDLDAVLGMISKRFLPAGTVLRTEHLERAPAVAKGDTVRLRVTVGVANVATAAIAQSSGKIGDVIPVKNVATGRVLRSRVEGAGEVRLTQ
jgi:flagella basal body P-ring formation protein FlgA